MGRDSWVITTRVYGFYESLGYVIAAKCYLGEGNPTWHKSLPEIILVSSMNTFPDIEANYKQMHRRARPSLSDLIPHTDE